MCALLLRTWPWHKSGDRGIKGGGEHILPFVGCGSGTGIMQVRRRRSSYAIGACTPRKCGKNGSASSIPGGVGTATHAQPGSVQSGSRQLGPRPWLWLVFWSQSRWALWDAQPYPPYALACVRAAAQTPTLPPLPPPPPPPLPLPPWLICGAGLQRLA